MFLEFPDGVVLDFDLQFLSEMVALIDAKLEALDQEAARSDAPDAFGIFDRVEFVAGIGFATCQRYIGATAGSLKMPKERALSFGPALSDGTPMVRAVNATANFWKHHEEWDGQGRPVNRGTLKVLESIPGMVVPARNASTTRLVDYVCAHALHQLCLASPMSFQPIVQSLVLWRDALREAV